MSAALLERPVPLFAEAAPAGRRAGGGPTLEERLSGAWRGLHADGAVECPVCRQRMRLVEKGGECGECGSRLS